MNERTTQRPLFGPVKTGTCLRCKRVLTATASVEAGMGPVCAARMRARAEERTADLYDLPFDWATMDIGCRRDAAGRLHTNIPQRHVHHSGTGFEWGYGGSGPADFALNILAIYLPVPKGARVDPLGRGGAVRLHDGSLVSHAAWGLHQDFKARFVGRLPDEGGTIRGDDIRAWLARRLGEEVAA